MINYTPMDDDSMRVIFESILGAFVAPFADPIKALVPGVVTATISVYNTIIDGLLPTPSKPHYTFNLRDFSRVIEGLFMVTPASAGTPALFTRAWLHEVLRSFHDQRQGQDRQPEARRTDIGQVFPAGDVQQPAHAWPPVRTIKA